MAGKPISSVLEKIRRRKMEVSKKTMFPGSVQCNDSITEIKQESDRNEAGFVFAAQEIRPRKAASGEPIAETSSAPDVDPYRTSQSKAREDETSVQMHLAKEPTLSFRAPLKDSQDLFSDSQMSEMQSEHPNENSSCLAEEYAASSLPSLNLIFDSEVPDDICSEESDEDNIEPHPQSLFKQNSSPKGDPVKEFVDEEAFEDDSDNDLLQFKDEDECNDVEEICDYIATDYKEKSIDREKRNELHQMWLQQQDEAGTENLLQKLKHGRIQREPSILRDKDDDSNDREEDESDNDDLLPMTAARMSTKKLRQMIPQMFPDKDDGFVSSEDEETERKFSKQRLLQKLELEQPKLLSPGKDKTSSEVFGLIKKLNTVPESKKKARSYLFDSLLTNGGSNSSVTSSFLRRSSSHPVSSSHKTGRTTGRSFIFGRDDSNSRSSILSDDGSNSNQKQSHTKKNASATFISSQAKRSASQADNRSGASSSTSLFEVLRRSSMAKGDDSQGYMVDHKAVFAAFKPLNKRVKTEGGP